MATARITELLKGWHSSNRESRWGYAARDFFPESWNWCWLPAGGKKIIIEDAQLTKPVVLQGTLPKRIAKFYKDVYGSALPENIISKIGDAIKLDDPNLKAAFWDLRVEFDWHDGDFGDKGSCFWSTDRRIAKDHIQNHGGMAMRYYRNNIHDNDNGIARAFLIPHRNKAGKEMWIVTNGYGLNTQSICRFFAQETGKAYKLIELVVDGRWDGVVYINAGGKGYVVGEAEDIAPITKIDLKWNARYSHDSSNSSVYSSSHNGAYCTACDDEIDPDYARMYDDEYYCNNCYWNRHSICGHCFREVSFQSLTNIRDQNLLVCGDCLETYYHPSMLSGNWYSAEVSMQLALMRSDGRVDQVFVSNEEFDSNDFNMNYVILTWPAEAAGKYAYRRDVIGMNDNEHNHHDVLRRDTSEFQRLVHRGELTTPVVESNVSYISNTAPDISGEYFTALEPQPQIRDINFNRIISVVSIGTELWDNPVITSYVTPLYTFEPGLIEDVLESEGENDDEQSGE